MRGVPCGPLIRPFGPPSPRGEKRVQGAPAVPKRTACLTALPPTGWMATRQSLSSPPWGEGGPKGRMRGPHARRQSILKQSHGKYLVAFSFFLDVCYWRKPDAERPAAA
ncbi:hypothetical protein RHEC894_PD00474 (plasmid) [Rhizobium sp. CIAT894]|nr:hypothetical protein RHEC894_PD00474 [Rhizobium sp. CIAT894]